jgi:hypothetical protein
MSFFHIMGEDTLSFQLGTLGESNKIPFMSFFDFMGKTPLSFYLGTLGSFSSFPFVFNTKVAHS